MTIQQIKQQLEDIRYEEWVQIFPALSQDPRAGVQTLLRQKERHFEREKTRQADFERRMTYEREWKRGGYSRIVGVDEVGRGPLAGPVVAAAVLLPDGFYLSGLNDSKKMTKTARDAAYAHIMEVAEVGVGIVEPKTIDDINIYESTKLAMTEAIRQVGDVDALLIDAMKLDLDIPQQSLIKGDALSVSIAAASVVAKVVRDRMMEAYDLTYPGYGFAKNAGYGTEAHIDGLRRLGVTPIHRLTFAPVKHM
ncbi:ribonuclease HII [Exiguobacterium qingdaonense]|uniref:ribonuclease HII n=1 Tax=Exiguobacterium qingdaonense TaxID=2751251 RepID=UPI001BE8C5C8